MMQMLDTMTQEELGRMDSQESCFGSLETERGHLPLEAMTVRTRIAGLMAHTELEQSFVNTMDEPIEATYMFPLPDRAAVGRFRMRAGGRVIEGVLEERGKARQVYEQAIEAGHRAAITEEDRAGVFTMRVGNIEPGQSVSVTLSLSGPLAVDEGEVTFRFPLVVAPRYIPGVPLEGRPVGDGVAPDTDAVPDASRITPPVLLPGYPNPVRLALSVDIDPGGLPVSGLRSSLHAAVSSESGERRRIELEPGERLDRDFVLRFNVADEVVRTGLVLSPDDEGDEGTFTVTLVPPTGDADKPRDVVFVLDRSGSMGGWSMVAARRAAARMVDTLRDKDRFSVMAFDNRIEVPASSTPGELDAATDRNRFRAVEFLAGLEARGGTEMARPLELAADALAGGYADRDRVLVLVTDGQVGNEDQILRSLAKRLKSVRIFTLGIDSAVNAAFLRRLAAVGGGMCELVESEDRLDEVMDRVHRRIGTPVVTELHLAPEGIEVVEGSVVPARIPDLFTGAPVTITGRFRGAPEGRMELRGMDAVGTPWTESVSGCRVDNPALAKVWARGQVRALEDRYVIGRGDLGALERDIVATSLRFSVLCRFTAFVAVDESERVSDGDPHRVIQPVEMPHGWNTRAGGMPVPQAASAPAPMMKTMLADFEAVAAAPRAEASGAGGGAGAVSKTLAGMAAGVGAVLGAPGAAARAVRGRKGKKRSKPRPKKEMAKPAPVFDEADDELAAEEEAFALDLSPYVKRVAEMSIELVRSVGARDATWALKRLVIALQALLDDMRSVGAAPSWRRELEELLSSIRNELGADADKATRLAERAAGVLDSVGRGDKEASAERPRDAFWK